MSNEWLGNVCARSTRQTVDPVSNDVRQIGVCVQNTTDGWVDPVSNDVSQIGVCAGNTRGDS